VRKADAATTYRAFPDGEGGAVYRAVRVDYTDGGFLNFSYDRGSGLLWPPRWAPARTPPRCARP